MQQKKQCFLLVQNKEPVSQQMEELGMADESKGNGAEPTGVHVWCETKGWTTDDHFL